MELKPGYKQTEVGVIPEDWDVSSVGEKGQVVAGKALAVNAPGKQRPYLRTKNVFDGRIDIEDVLSMPMTDEQFAQFQLRHGDVLLNEGQSLDLVGRCSVYKEEYPEPCAIQNALLRFRANTGTSAAFATHLFRHCQQTGVFAKIALQTTSVAHLGSSRFANLKLAWPTENEQRLIAAALDELDALLSSLEVGITKKTSLKQATMQELLTGKRRLPGFEGEWVVRRIADVGEPCSEKNTEGAILPVLTCSKHVGFMDSLGYFKNQVFSKDLSAYKVIRRDEIGYPANHIEEGSIGLQALYDTALVSPIYVVFRVTEDVSSYFLHRLLKLDSYRHRFRTATSSSVDRRGSLRWPAFSEITAVLPPTRAEQDAIAAVLSDLEAELSSLEARLIKTRSLKQGIMNELLTGRTRLI